MSFRQERSGGPESRTVAIPWLPAFADDRMALSPLNRGRIALGEAALVPIGIGERLAARLVERRDLFVGQGPAGRAEVLPQLLFVAGADDDGRDGRAPEQPVERDLR